MIRTIFFDFGGCIDSAGIHTRTLFWDSFLKHQIVFQEQRAEFQEAYTRADDKMMRSGIAKSMALREFNRLNGSLIAADLGLQTKSIIPACDDITEGMSIVLRRNAPILKKLSEAYPLRIISNFTGNLETILQEFSLRELFQSVTESYYVGASKPERKIFEAALATQNFSPNECLYIGDNPKNDIIPGKAIGMRCVLIHSKGNKIDCGADGYIEDLAELFGLIQRI